MLEKKFPSLLIILAIYIIAFGVGYFVYYADCQQVVFNAKMVGP